MSDPGKHDASKMGKRLAKRGVKPDQILSSPARRALKTARVIARKIDYRRRDIVVHESLYAVTANDLLTVIHKLGTKLECVMIVGHNPELTELAHRLADGITHLPTCAIAELTFNTTSWKGLGKATLAGVAVDQPKKMRGGTPRP